jgi:hypothetical protein
MTRRHAEAQGHVLVGNLIIAKVYGKKHSLPIFSLWPLQSRTGGGSCHHAPVGGSVQICPLIRKSPEP